MMRLDKFISHSGIASRREASALVRQGRVAVDGKTVASPDMKIDENSALVSVDGEQILSEESYYYMLNKPAGVVSATKDGNEKTVIDLLGEREKRLELFPVGRLDKDTTGLLILTNDGAFAHSITSPKKHIPKCYLAGIDAAVTEDDVAAFRDGITLSDGSRCLPAELKPASDGALFCHVTIYEGKYHQVKRMLAARGKHVTSLERLSIGGLGLDAKLCHGDYRLLTNCEKNAIVLQDC